MWYEIFYTYKEQLSRWIDRYIRERALGHHVLIFQKTKNNANPRQEGDANKTIRQILR